MLWIVDIVRAMRELGGRAELFDLYREVAERRGDSALPDNYKSSIRQRSKAIAPIPGSTKRDTPISSQIQAEAFGVFATRPLPRAVTFLRTS